MTSFNSPTSPYHNGRQLLSPNTPRLRFPCWLVASWRFWKANHTKLLIFNNCIGIFSSNNSKGLSGTAQDRAKSLKAGSMVLKDWCLWPKSAKSWWISSETNKTPCFWRDAQSFSNTSFSQTRPPGWTGYRYKASHPLPPIPSQLVKVNLKQPILSTKELVINLRLFSLDTAGKRWIDRCVNQNSLSFFCKGLNSCWNGWVPLPL